MIQRKQSIFLLITAVLLSWLLVRPYAELRLEDGHRLTFYCLTIRNFTTPQDFEIIRHTIMLFMLIIVTGALNFVNIFLYNRRIIQLRMCLVSSALLVIILLTMLYYYITVRNGVNYTIHLFRLAAVFPIVGLIMNFLAYRAINQDEMLVKSYDHLR
jgi:hypothetical protein